MIFKALKRIFFNMRYAAIATAGSLGFLAVSAVLPNFRLIKWAMGADTMAADEKLYFFANVIAGVYRIDPVSFATFFTFTIAVLFGINIAMGIYSFQLWKFNLHSWDGGTPGLLGMFAGFLGVGCSACGSVALSSLLSLIGAGSALSYLPLGGREFAILSIFLLLLSIHQISRNITTPKTCPAPEKHYI